MAKPENKQIYKILEEAGVNANYSVIVHDSLVNPILYFFLAFATVGFGFVIQAISALDAYGVVLLISSLLIIFVLYYLFWAYKSYSFVISGTEIYAVNPNFPFQSLNKIGKTEIKSIKMGRDRNYGLSYLFFSFYNCYLEVSTDEKIHRFYCYSLEDEYYDNFEGWETKTTDGLEYQLKSKGYPIELTNNFF